MPVSQSLRTALTSSGYQLIDAPEVPWGGGQQVVDAEGAQWFCSLAEVCSPREWDAAEEVAAELASGRHRHIVGLHDVVTMGEGHEPDGGECSAGDTTGPIQRVLIWAAGSPAQRLGEYRTRHQLDLGQISAALVAAGRGLASLDSLGLPVPAHWCLDDLVLQQDGILQIRLGSITTDGETKGAEQLRQVARNGQVLLSDVDGDQRSPDLAHLLTATAFDEAPVGAGTFAALCHELVPPADAGSWLFSPASRQEPDSCIEPEDVRDADAARTAGVTGRTDATRYSDLTHDWRNYVRTGTRSAQVKSGPRRFGLTLPTWMSATRTSPIGRHKADSAARKGWQRRRALLAVVGAGILVAGLGTHMFLGSSGAEPTAEATPRSAGDSTEDAPTATAKPAPEQQQERDQQQEGKQGQAPDSEVLDPGAAAMDLTEERLRILQDLRSEQSTKSGKSDSDSQEQRLATVLVPASPAMSADLRLVSDLVESTASTKKVVAEARTARTLRHEDDTAVVEVSYDLVDPDAGRVAQSATLTLTLIEDCWLVKAVSDVPPTEPQL